MDLPLPDENAAASAYQRLATLDLPGAGFGSLADVVKFVGGVRGTDAPGPFAAPRLVIVSGDHAGGVAAGYPPDWSARRLAALRDGSDPVALLAERAGVVVEVVEAPPSAAIEHDDALGHGEVAEALRLGAEVADRAVDGGTDLLVLAGGGIGADPVATAVTVATAGGEAASLLPRVVSAAGDVDDAAWMRRCTAVRDALHRIRARSRDTTSTLSALGGGDLAVAVGLIVTATLRRTPVIVDGALGVAAGLLARDIGAQTRHWLLLADHGQHPTTTLGADVLGLRPLLDLRLGLGDGAAALVALPILQAMLAVAHHTRVRPEPPGETAQPGGTEQPGGTAQPGGTEQPGGTARQDEAARQDKAEPPGETGATGKDADRSVGGGQANGGGQKPVEALADFDPAAERLD